MSKTIDFNGLLKDLFQEDVPIREKLQGYPQPNQAEKRSTDYASMIEGNISPLQACDLYVFMRKIIIEKFGMGYDYAISDREGIPLKSWFTIPEAIEAAKSQGYKLSVSEARAYLDELIKQRYIETDNYKYRRCALWDERMKKYFAGLLPYRNL